MKEYTITKNTPTRPDKVAFYKSLVSFYTSTIESGIALNEEQTRANDAINEFDNGNIHLHYQYEVKAIDPSVVANLTPMHHRKRNLYKCLVAFFDASLAKVKDTKEEDTDNTDYNVLVCLVGDAIKGCEDLKAIVLAPIAVVVEHKAETAKAKRKTYSVKVVKRKVYHASVVAISEEDAIRKAKALAEDTTEDEWSNEDDTYVSDIEDNIE